MQQSRQRTQDKGGRLRRILLAAGLGLLAGAAESCEIALALAVDVSGSVDSQEYRIQMQGLAEALRDGAVADALVAAKARVMLVQWTGDSRQEVSVPWRAMESPADVAGLAERIESVPRRWWQFSTAIGSALEFIRTQFTEDIDCARKVIDVSGDGISNEGIAPASLRGRLWREGFTVNALAIEGTEGDLTVYYWENVVVGDKAFVVTANGFEEYPARIRLKLLRELTEQVSALAPQGARQQ